MGGTLDIKYITKDQVMGLARRINQWPTGQAPRSFTLAVNPPLPVNKHTVKNWAQQVVRTAWLKWPGVHVHVVTALPVRDPAGPDMLRVVNFNRNLCTAVKLIQNANREKLVVYVPWHKWLLAAGKRAPADGVWEMPDLMWLRDRLMPVLQVEGLLAEGEEDTFGGV